MKWIISIWFFVASVYAQERVSLTNEKPRVAVLLFDAAKVSDKQVFDRAGVDAFSEAATQKVINAFVDLKRFIVIERAAIDKILQEQNFQMGDLTDPDTAAKFGNMLGTQYLVQGKILNLSTSKKEKKYRSTLEMNLRIIDVSSGQIKSSKDIKGTSDAKKDLSSKIAYDALNDAGEGILNTLRSAFPVEGKIVKILESGKKDKLRVLISCGKEIGVREGDKFHIVQEEELMVDGKAYTRQKAMGKLRVKRLELDGIFSECEVLDGEKFLKSQIAAGNELKVISAE
ncbi:CsgG/HfaB family protein [bacterium]|nr:CsgG/HfaB family protein [bacterium]